MVRITAGLSIATRSNYKKVHMLGAMIVATEDEASTHRANVPGGSVTRKYGDFFVSRDLEDVISKPTIIDEFPSAPHKPVQLVLRAEKKKEMKMQVR